jgi:hypothetical protein
MGAKIRILLPKSTDNDSDQCWEKIATSISTARGTDLPVFSSQPLIRGFGLLLREALVSSTRRIGQQSFLLMKPAPNVLF